MAQDASVSLRLRVLQEGLSNLDQLLDGLQDNDAAAQKLRDDAAKLAAELAKLKGASDGQTQASDALTDQLDKAERQLTETADAARRLHDAQQQATAAERAAAEAAKEAAAAAERHAAAVARDAQALQKLEAAAKEAADELRKAGATSELFAQQDDVDSVAKLRQELEKLSTSIDPQTAARAAQLAAELARMGQQRDAIAALDQLRGRTDGVRQAAAAASQAVDDYTRTIGGAKNATAEEAAQLNVLSERARTARLAYLQHTQALAAAEQALRAMGVQTDRAAAGLQKTDSAARQATRSAAQLGAEVRNTAGHIGGLNTELTQVAQGIATAFAGRELVLMGAGMEAVTLGLKAIHADAGAVATDLELVRHVSMLAGVDMIEAGKALLSIRAATQGTAVEGQKTAAVFEAVATSMARAGKSSAETGNALRALEQMASKGTVSMEELRGQLGEALPGALNAAARGLGVTTQQLIALVESGRITANEIFPALTAGLTQLYGGVGDARSLSAELTNIRNALVLMAEDIGNAGGLAALKSLAQIAHAAIVVLDAGIVAMGKNIGTVMSAVANLDFSQLRSELSKIEIEGRTKILKAAQYNDLLRSTLESVGSEAAKSALEAQKFAAKVDAGTASIERTGAAAQTAGQAVAAGGAAGAAGMAGMVAKTNAAEDAIKQVVGAAQAKLPQIGPTIDQQVAKMADLASKSRDVADAVGRQIPEAIAKLSGAELDTVRGKLLRAFSDPAVPADLLKKTVVDIGLRAAEALGVDAYQGAQVLSQGFVEAQNNLSLLVRSFDGLRERGYDAARIVKDALTSMIDGAKNQAELDALRQRIEALGKAGLISKEQVGDMLDTLKRKAAELVEGVQTLDEALKVFGLQSRADMQKTADTMGAAWAKIRDDATVAIAQKRQAFEQYAAAVVAATGGIVTEQLKVEAAMLGVEIAADSAGRVIVTSMASAADATQGAAQAAMSLTGELDSATEAQRRYNAAKDAELHVREQALYLAQREKALRDAERNVDANGFSLDMTGSQTVQAAGITPEYVQQLLKSMGLTDEQAAQVARGFVQNGRVVFQGDLVAELRKAADRVLNSSGIGGSGAGGAASAGGASGASSSGGSGATISGGQSPTVTKIYRVEIVTPGRGVTAVNAADDASAQTIARLLSDKARAQ